MNWTSTDTDFVGPTVPVYGFKAPLPPLFFIFLDSQEIVIIKDQLELLLSVNKIHEDPPSLQDFS